MVVRHAFEEDNAVLADKISAVSADVSKPGGAKLLEEQIRNRRSGERTIYWVRVLDGQENVIAETPGMKQILPSTLFPKPSAPSEEPKDYRLGPQLFSLVSTVVHEAGQPYTIEVAQDRSGDIEFAKSFGALLAIVLVLCIIASALIATTVTRRGLRPLTEMTQSAERIGPTHLSERVGRAEWPRELQPLANAFDQMLDRLENSFTRLSQFSADLAHELRTPIANILGESQVTLTRARTADEYREVVESAVAECERLSGIVDNLLFVARADTAREEIARSSFDGRSAIEKIANYYRTIAEERNVAIISDGQGEVFADPVLFNRALSNLVDNALRFTPDGGTIQISIAVQNQYAEVSVRDNGCGIAAEHVPRVFDRFYRVDASRNPHGAGLGLALVKSITELHGGSASITSETEHGTTVTVTFPKDSPAQAKA